MRTYEWVTHAAERGQVTVTIDGEQYQAVLIAWRPRRSNGSRRNVARVELSNGRRRTVPLTAVHIAETQTA